MPNIEHSDSGADDGRGCRAHRRGEHCPACAGGHSQGFAFEKAISPEDQLRGAVDALAKIGLVIDDDWLMREARTGEHPRDEIRRLILEGGR